MKTVFTFVNSLNEGRVQGEEKVERRKGRKKMCDKITIIQKT